MTEKGGIYQYKFALDTDNETLHLELVNSFSKECWGVVGELQSEA
jgi:hypothetical protein